MVSGSPDVSNSFVSPYSNSFVSPYSNSFVSHCAGGVRLSGCLQIHLSSLWRQFICLPVWLVLSGCPFVSPYSNSFVSQSGWWCPALRMSAIDLSPIIAIYLFPSLAGGVRLYRCARFICLALQQFICLPVWLVVSGSPDVVPQLPPRMLSPSCFQGFYICCLVFHLSPRCGLPVVSQMWFPRCCLTVRWF